MNSNVKCKIFILLQQENKLTMRQYLCNNFHLYSIIFCLILCRKKTDQQGAQGYLQAPVGLLFLYGASRSEMSNAKSSWHGEHYIYFTFIIMNVPLNVTLSYLPFIFFRICSNRFNASYKVSSFFAKCKRIRWFTSSLKKLEPGTAPTPTSRARTSQNSTSFS